MMKTTFDSWRQPNEEVVRCFVNAFDINYHRDEKELKNLFDKQLSNMTKDEQASAIYNRVARLNALYHTHLWRKDIDDIVSFLNGEGVGFEKIIKSGDVETVSAIAKCENRNCFVFATKYCSFINPDFYPIYDSLVCKALIQFNQIKHFGNITEAGLDNIRKNREYEKFKSIVDGFLQVFNLNTDDFRYKDIDKFLWIVGKNLDNGEW